MHTIECAETPDARQGLWMLAGSTLVMLCLGGVYAWSTFVPALQSQYGYSNVQTQLVFGVSICSFTVTMIISGRLLPRIGPRRLTLISAALFTAGYLLASLSGGVYALVLMGIGVLAGAAIGCGYVAPLAVTPRWFPHHHGLAMGVVTAGFGGGAVALSNAGAWALHAGMPVLQWFAWQAIGYGLVLAVCSRLMSTPPAAAVDSDDSAMHALPVTDATFWALVLGMFCGACAGLLVVGNLKPIGLDWGLHTRTATAAVSVFAVGNAVGRLTWGWLADRWPARKLATGMLLTGSAMLAMWPVTSAWGAAYLVVTLCIAFYFGGCFVLFAAIVSDMYGDTNLPITYPWIFLAYGFSALVGPPVGGWLSDQTGAYQTAVGIAAVTCLLGAAGYELLMRIGERARQKRDMPAYR